MKIVSVRVELKQGLPNYSSRTAEVVAVADESESLDIQGVVLSLSAEIKQAWTPKVVEATPELEKAIAAPQPLMPVVEAPKSAPITEIVKELKEEPKKRAPKKAAAEEIVVEKPQPKKTSNPLDED